MDANSNLDYRLMKESYGNFKSEGERRIASFLKGNSIKYRYEPALAVNSEQGKPRIWYPDFYLPEFKTYIEYYGMAGKPCYDQGIKQKENVYSKMGLDVVSVYPWMFKEDWKGYLMKGLKRNIDRQYRSFNRTPYWRRKAFSIYKGAKPFVGYRRGHTVRY